MTEPHQDLWTPDGIDRHVKAFLRDSTVADPTGSVGAAELHERYRAWCEGRRIGELSTTLLSRYLRKHVTKVKRGTVFYVGICLRPEPSNPP